jgi:tetratricopeptide (TPR) repeat protein
VAARRYANTEAIAAYRQALALAKQGEASGADLAGLCTRLGRALELNAQYDQALILYEDMETLARQRGDRSLELTALLARATIHAILTYDPDRGEALAERALSLARELGDQTAEAKALWILFHVYGHTGRLSQAIDCGERSLALARALNLREQMAFTLNDLGGYWTRVVGRLDRAKEVLREASDLWRELGNRPMLADSLGALCICCVFAGEYDQALALSEEAFQLSQSIHNLWGQSFSRYWVGHVYWERGEPDRAIAVMDECIRLGEWAGFVAPQAVTRADLAMVYGRLGAIERGLDTARLALTMAETQFPWARAYVLGVLAQLHLLHGDLAQAEAALDQGKQDPFREASTFLSVPILLADGELALRQGDYERALAVIDSLLTAVRQWGARSYRPGVLYLQSQAWLALGQDEAGHARLLEARAEAEALGARWWLWQILAALSRLEAQRGAAAEADNLRRQAREIIASIADHAGTPELRASFLNLSQVRMVLNQELPT